MLYVGKAANLRRRLRAHFADRRWCVLPPALAGVAAIEWQQADSEIEALLREVLLSRDLQPVVNVQTAAPTLATRAIPPSLVEDVVLLVPSIDPDTAELVAARDDGATMLRRTPRSGAELARHSRELWRFFTQRSGAVEDGSAPLVFSWLAGRGLHTTRLNLRDSESARHLRVQLGQLARVRCSSVQLHTSVRAPSIAPTPNQSRGQAAPHRHPVRLPGVAGD